MLMGAKVGTLEHVNTALVALEHDRSAQEFHKTGTVVSLQDKDCREFAGHCLEFARQEPNLEDCCKARPRCETVGKTKVAKPLRKQLLKHLRRQSVQSLRASYRREGFEEANGGEWL